MKSKIGWTFINPFTQQFVEYPISTEYLILTASETEGSEQNDSVDTPTLEGQNVNVDVAVAFHVTDAKALYIKYRGASVDYLKQVVIRNSLNSNLMSVTGKMSILSINEESDKICLDTKNRMNTQLNDEGIVIERVELRAKRLPQEVQE